MSSADLTLLAQWRDKRDAQAFKELTSKYAPKVYATCRRILGNAAEAEDATQECFAKLAGARRSPTGSLGAWLHKVATNQALEHIRMDSRRRRREAAFIAEHPAQTEASWDDISGFVDEAIANLPDNLRIPVVEFFLNDRSQMEIANEFGVSRQTVTYRIGKGVDAIRKALRKRGIVIGASAITALLHGHMAEAAVLPPSLAGYLGRLDLAGPPASVGVATLLSHLAASKTAAIALATVAVVVAVPLAFTRLASTPEMPGSVPVSAPASTLQAQESSGDQVPASPPDESRQNNRLLPAAAPAASAPSIVGRVYDADTGRGIPSVSVIAENRAAREFLTAQTDVTGRFAFTTLHEGQVKLSWSSAKGYPQPQDTDAKTIMVKAGGVVEVEFPLAKGLGVTGVVLDTAGKPIAGVHVNAETIGSAGRQFASCDEGGAFTLLGFAPGDEVTLRAFKNIDGETKLRSLECGPFTVREDGLHSLEIVVHELGSISGKVVDPEGKPVNRAYVRAAPEKLQAASSSARSRMEAGESSKEDGTFRIAGLFPGTWQIGFIDTGTQQVVTISPGEEVRGLTLVFTGETPEPLPSPGALAISGKVSTLDGRPVPDVSVLARGESDETLWSHGDARVDDNGFFTIEGLVAGPYSLVAYHPEYNTAEQAGVAAGTRGVFFQLTKHAHIEGRVVQSETGEPIADFAVGRMSATEIERIQLETSLVQELLLLSKPQNMHDSGGAFVLDNTEAGDNYVVARAEGFAPAYVRVPAPAPGQNPAPVTIELEPEARVEGLVVSDRNKPVEGAFIFEHPLHNSRDRAESIKKLAVARSDSNGAFTVGGLPGGTLTLSAYHSDYSIAAADVTLKSGEITPLTLTLPGGATLQGTVRHAGQPVTGQQVRIEGANESTKTLSDGTYRFQGLAAGEVKVSASLQLDDLVNTGPGKSRYLRKAAVLAVGSTTVVDFEFVPADAGLEATISINEQVPQIATLSLEIQTPSGDVELFRHDTLEGRGDFRFESLPSGQATLWATAICEENKRHAKYMLSLEAGKVLSFDIDFLGGCVIDGTISGQAAHEQCGLFLYSKDRVSPERLARILNTLNSVKGDADASTLITAGGTFHVEGLSPGNYTAVVFAIDPAAENEEARIKTMRYAVAPVTLTGPTATTLHINLE